MKARNLFSKNFPTTLDLANVCIVLEDFMRRFDFRTIPCCTVTPNVFSIQLDEALIDNYILQRHMSTFNTRWENNEIVIERTSETPFNIHTTIAEITRLYKEYCSATHIVPCASIGLFSGMDILDYFLTEDLVGDTAITQEMHTWLENFLAYDEL